MKKYAIYLIALSAISTPSLASQGEYELKPLKMTTKVSVRAVARDQSALTGFRRLKNIVEENRQIDRR